MINNKFDIPGNFLMRHIGISAKTQSEMLETIGVGSLDQLIDETVPAQIRLQKDLQLPKRLAESEYLRELEKIGAQNKVYRSYIGMGYFGTVTPSPIQRNILENPGWYTQYTPYQAEIAQGRLEALLNFQTLVTELTKMEIANSSLLDEGTAAAEAMSMMYGLTNKKKTDSRTVFLVSDMVYPQTLDILYTRAEPLGIEIKVQDPNHFEFNESVIGALVQYPNGEGDILDYPQLTTAAHDAGALVCFAADLMSLALLTPPGDLGADIVIGNTQRFGVPMGFGGPHAAFFACREAYKRVIPGRIIGVSVDTNGKPALRMALQTREQHIRREKATSNICTAQALLAIMAGMYGVYHGPDGLKAIAERIHLITALIEKVVTDLGFKQLNSQYFDTLKIETGEYTSKIREVAGNYEVNFRYFEDHNHIGISMDEATTLQDIETIIRIFTEARGEMYEGVDFEGLQDSIHVTIADENLRSDQYLQHDVFHKYRSETELMRYIKALENKDLSLTHSMISLGSCTMKLNAATELMPISWPAFANMHPFAPEYQTTGYRQILSELEEYLAEITGFTACSLQPNSGAQGEYAGLMAIRAYHKANGNKNRNIALIPSSAHGTNPASAVMAGMKVVVVACDENGNIDFADLEAKATEHSDNLSSLMVTYPSTHGVFEEKIKEICQLIHDHGGLVYMDGANMNAQVGLTSPGYIGADVCHLNLHKTFAIPHGGGGPGMGPICVNDKLAPFLPGHTIIPTGGDQATTAISAAPFGSASILLISYAYIRLLGQIGVKEATKVAILNANYIKARLSKEYPVLYTGTNGRVAHELILDFRKFKQSVGIEVEDIAKRLIDYGFHAPTVSFPVAGTIMIEPTESESKDELDRFCDALISIREEIAEIESGEVDKHNNVLKNAPHTCEYVLSDTYDLPYSKSKAAYPLQYVRDKKFWPSVGRVNNSHGDRNLICTCPSIEEYV